MRNFAGRLAAVACVAAGALRGADLVDHHQHLFSVRAANHSAGAAKGISARELLRHLDAAGIRRAVVLSVAYTFSNPNKPAVANEPRRVRQENDWTSTQVARSAGRLTGFCSVNPLREYAVPEVQRCAKDRHLRTGLKLHFGNSDVDLDNPDHVGRVQAVFRAANANGMALAVHMRGTVSRNRPHGARQARVFLERLLPEAPDVPVQIAHLAGAGGYDLATDEALAVFAEEAQRGDPRMRRVFFDVSGVAGFGTWQDRAELIARRIRQLGLTRVLYGSDAAVPGNRPQEALANWRKLPLTEGEFRVVEGNAAPYLR